MIPSCGIGDQISTGWSGAAHTIITSLHHCDSSRSLARQPVAIMAKLLHQSEKFINAKKVEVAKKAKAQQPPQEQMHWQFEYQQVNYLWP